MSRNFVPVSFLSHLCLCIVSLNLKSKVFPSPKMTDFFHFNNFGCFFKNLLQLKTLQTAHDLCGMFCFFGLPLFVFLTQKIR